MLKDEIAKYDNLTTQTGACKYCGQFTQVKVPEVWGGEMVDELVTEICECPEAMTYASMKKRRERAHEKIIVLFGEKASKPVDDNTEKLLHMAADAALEWDIEKMSVDIKDGTKGKITRTAKGSIKIERSESSKNAYEL